MSVLDINQFGKLLIVRYGLIKLIGCFFLCILRSIMHQQLPTVLWRSVEHLNLFLDKQSKSIIINELLNN